MTSKKPAPESLSKLNQLSEPEETKDPMRNSIFYKINLYKPEETKNYKIFLSFSTRLQEKPIYKHISSPMQASNKSTSLSMATRREDKEKCAPHPTHHPKEGGVWGVGSLIVGFSIISSKAGPVARYNTERCITR